MLKKLFFVGIFLQAFVVNAQLFAPEHTFTHDDTLRGSITPQRAWWDLKHYHLQVRVNPTDSTFTGQNTITYQVLKAEKLMQIDLQKPMQVTKVVQNGRNLHFTRDGNAFFIQLPQLAKVGKTEKITVYFTGKPKVAVNPPWDGGVSWKHDKHGHWFIATSCQGLGASVWWPCKDHMYDEPDSMRISVTVPQGLTDVSNGRLAKVTHHANQTSTFDWVVRNPINNYGVNVNIGTYTHFSDVFQGEKGALSLDYYVLPDNLAKAQEQFKQASLMLKAFEHWFGPYPFYEDGYKLVEVPYLGMEHQSSVTYGNRYQNGYLGRDLSGTGWGLKWDFIIVHESGHEWFANNITYKDIADMWIHESFTNYSESLFTEYYYGKEAAQAYVIGCRKNIRNDRPIIGFYDVNNEGSGDMYYKGGNMLNTIREAIHDDALWREILRGLNQTFYHQTVTTQQIENYISTTAKIDFSKVFDQYLRHTAIPVLEHKYENGAWLYRWNNCVAGFNMKMGIRIGDAYTLLKPTEAWQQLPLSAQELAKLTFDKNFYVNILAVK